MYCHGKTTRRKEYTLGVLLFLNINLLLNMDGVNTRILIYKIPRFIYVFVWSHVLEQSFE